MAEHMNFSIDVESYLGMNFECHKSKMLALSLSNPTEYETARADIVKKLRNENVKRIYKTLMDFMVKGTDGSATNSPINSKVVPGYPAQHASAFCLSAAETLNKIFVDAVDICMPVPYSRVALTRDSDLGKASAPLGP
jgi:hypothetical protein